MNALDNIERSLEEWGHNLRGGTSSHGLQPRDVLHTVLSSMEENRVEGLDHHDVVGDPDLDGVGRVPVVADQHHVAGVDVGAAHVGVVHPRPRQPPRLVVLLRAPPLPVGPDRRGRALRVRLVGLVRTLAVELGPHGITTNAIAPGLIETPQSLDPVNSLGPEGVREFASSVPVRRNGQPEDVAYAFLFLASEEASYVNGQVLLVDGGVSLAF